MWKTHGTIDPNNRLDIFALRKLKKLDGQSVINFDFPDGRVTIFLEYIQNYNGGFRIYFNCPKCGRPSRYLYFTGARTVACRECAKLNYPSQQRTRRRWT